MRLLPRELTSLSSFNLPRGSFCTQEGRKEVRAGVLFLNRLSYTVAHKRSDQIGNVEQGVACTGAAPLRLRLMS